MEITLSLLVIAIVSILILLWKKTRRANEYPPGPPTTPFIGNLNMDLRNIVAEFRKLRKQYGDIFSLIMGCKTVVVVNGLDTLKEIFIKNSDVTSERPDTIGMREIVKGLGVAGSSGPLWKEHRTFVLSTLIDFGFGKRSMEGRIMEEVEVLIECLKDTKGKSFSIEDLLHTSVSNVICSMAFGERYEHGDKKFIALTNSISENFRMHRMTVLITFLPFLRYIPGDPFGYQRVKANVAKTDGHLNSIINERMRAPITDNPTNYLDAFLQHQKRRY